MKMTLILSLLFTSFSTFAGYHCEAMNQIVDIKNATSGAPFVTGVYTKADGKKFNFEGKLTETQNEVFFTAYKFELIDAKGEKAIFIANHSTRSGGRGCSPRACAGMNDQFERITGKLTYLGTEHVLFCQKKSN